MFADPTGGRFPGRSQVGQPDADGAIRLTDSDAALARYSAVQKHYFNDPFIRPLLSRGAQYQPPRPPLINVGTYVRSEAIDSLVNEWLSLSQAEGKKCQIVSLGAGSDTRFWRIATGPQKDVLASYIELDFAENTTKKAMAIRKSRELSIPLGKPEDIKITHCGSALNSSVYHLVPADMRLPPADTLPPLLCPKGQPGILSPDLPTLLLFECVLSKSSTILGGVVYEMFGLNDSFGRVMLNNLKARNVDLPGVEPYPSFQSLPSRFLNRGFDASVALTLKQIRTTCISSEELQRISHLELLDELEELELVLQHYAITWGLKLYNRERGLNAAWNTWGLKPYHETREDEY
ncbi:Leucine carboxyl methyltransferase 1 [Abortiporus biennis]